MAQGTLPCEPIRRPHHGEVMVEKHRGFTIQSFFQLVGFDGIPGNAVGKVRRECLVFRAFFYLYIHIYFRRGKIKGFIFYFLFFMRNTERDTNEKARNWGNKYHSPSMTSGSLRGESGEKLGLACGACCLQRVE
jgi:hypothetical protein